MPSPASLPYSEPPIPTLLTLTSFLLLLNILHHLLDTLLSCGLIAQVLLGTAWGTPGLHLLPSAAEETIVQLGYLGLILMVYEGALSTSLPSLRANLALSLCVALTGVGLPIAFSFILMPLTNASRLQALVAGIALCSTSLGTMFSVLSPSGLGDTRLGVVLSSAAMIDDVFGLVCVQIATELGGEGKGVEIWVVLRPVLVSLGFVVGGILGGRFVLLPCVDALGKRVSDGYVRGLFKGMRRRRKVAWGVQMMVLVAFVTGASYAGTSNLFAAYLAGVMVSWWNQQQDRGYSDGNSGVNPQAKDDTPVIRAEDQWDQAASRNGTGSNEVIGKRQLQSNNQPLSSDPQKSRSVSGAIIYEYYYKQIVERILKPMFFASIGFSIPISSMFLGSIVWKGVVYAILMALGKIICGVWLVRIPMPVICMTSFWSECMPRLKLSGCFSGRSRDASPSIQLQCVKSRNVQPGKSDDPQVQVPIDQIRDGTGQTPQSRLTSTAAQKPISLYPATILGCAMVARGEIGFFISSIAQSNGIFESGSSESEAGAPSAIFLIVTWAIVLCTLVGPIAVGILVRRIKRLETKPRSGTQGQEGNVRNVLGVWGIT